MSQLRLWLFGPFQIALGGEPVAAHLTAKTQALLAYLAVEADAPHRRDFLAGLLWPDQSDKAARNGLRQALHQLCRAIGDATPPFLLITPQTVQFNPSCDSALDVAEFTALIQACDRHSHRRRETCPVCIARLQRAAALYRGDLLAEFFLKDSTAFEEWALVKREQLARMAFGAWRCLAEYHALRGEYRDMEQAARQQMAIDPFQEAAHRQLMRALAWSGQRHAALAQYEALRRLLAQELGVTPDGETTALRAQIESGALQPHAPLALCNWPARLTSFVGRDEELAQLAEWLQVPEVRLMTLVGPGGIGKTRLALQAAERETLAFLDGACWVPLADVSAPEFIVPAILRALGVSLIESSDPRAQLIHYLRETKQDLLLVLDSMEHLLSLSAPPHAEGGKGGAELVADMLRACPTLKILVTSREALALEGEWPLPVQGLALPPPDSMADLEAYSAAQLFLQRAQQARPSLALSAADRAIVARICELVGGMPLGLELAATWVKTLSCADIAREIERGLGFLASTLRDVPERHRSVRAALEHSWHLLTDQERYAFRCLAVFRGGFRREAAEAVVGDRWLAVGSQLVDKSLLRMTPSGRYEQHPLVRQYAEEKLAEAPGEQELAQERHGRYYVDFLYQRTDALKGSEQMRALAEIDQELENVRAMWQWAIAERRVAELGRCMECLGVFYRTRGLYYIGEAAFRQAVAALESEKPDPETAIALGEALIAQGWCCFHFGQFEQAQDLLEKSVAILRPTGALRVMAMALGWLGVTLWMRGDSVRAVPPAQEGLTLAQQSGDRWLIGVNLSLMGSCIFSQDGRKAVEYYRESVTTLRSIGDHWTMTTPLYLLGEAMRAAGDLAAARQILGESLAMARETNYRQVEAWSLSGLGRVAFALGDPSGARQHFQASLAIAREIGDFREWVSDLAELGDVTCALNDYTAAKEYFHDALKIAVQLEAWPQIVSFAIRCAGLLAGAREAEQQHAVEILAQALRHPAITQEDKARAECLLDHLRANLPPDGFAAAWEHGHARTLEGTIEEMLKSETALANSRLAASFIPPSFAGQYPSPYTASWTTSA